MDPLQPAHLTHISGWLGIEVERARYTFNQSVTNSSQQLSFLHSTICNAYLV